VNWKPTIVVTATGLVLQVLGGLDVSVDGPPGRFAKTLNYKGMMYSDVPQSGRSPRFTNASWTLKCRTSKNLRVFCRLINYMDRHGYKQCMPHTAIPLSRRSRRSISRPAMCSVRSRRFAEQGSNGRGGSIRTTRSISSPLRFGKIADGVMQYSLMQYS